MESGFDFWWPGAGCSGSKNHLPQKVNSCGGKYNGQGLNSDSGNSSAATGSGHTGRGFDGDCGNSSGANGSGHTGRGFDGDCGNSSGANGSGFNGGGMNRGGFTNGGFNGGACNGGTTDSGFLTYAGSGSPHAFGNICYESPQSLSDPTEEIYYEGRTEMDLITSKRYNNQYLGGVDFGCFQEMNSSSVAELNRFNSESLTRVDSEGCVNSMDFCGSKGMEASHSDTELLPNYVNTMKRENGMLCEVVTVVPSANQQREQKRDKNMSIEHKVRFDLSTRYVGSKAPVTTSYCPNRATAKWESLFTANGSMIPKSCLRKASLSDMSHCECMGPRNMCTFNHSNSEEHQFHSHQSLSHQPHQPLQSHQNSLPKRHHTTVIYTASKNPCAPLLQATLAPPENVKQQKQIPHHKHLPHNPNSATKIIRIIRPRWRLYWKSKQFSRNLVRSSWNNVSSSSRNVCSKMRGMGFGTDLQDRTSHEALLKVQDEELRLLESMRKCVTERSKCDRVYANDLQKLVVLAQKTDGTDNENPLFKTWKTLLQQTDELAKMIKDNADTLCTKTLEQLVMLISEKKSAKRYYLEEWNRLENEFAKLKDDMLKHKADYEKALAKSNLDKAKYEELIAKGKTGSKLEDAKGKFQRSTTKLHKSHNEYVMAVKEIEIHQQQYLHKTLPALLDFQQVIQETMISQSKNILEEYARQTDSSSESFSKWHLDLRGAIDKIKPKQEYTQFVEKHKSNPVPLNAYDFDASILTDYKGKLKPNTLAVDDLTFEFLVHSKATLEDQIKATKTKRENTSRELEVVQAESADMSVENSANFVSQKKKLETLKKTMTELECQEEKLAALIALLNGPIEKLGENPPPAALDFQEIVDKDDAASNSSKDAPQPGGRLSTLKSTINKKMKKPPPGPASSQPPQKGDLDSNSDTTKKNPERYSEVTAGGGHASIISDGGSYQQDSESHRKIVENEDWFHGVLPRDEVQRLLKNDGDYLVRESKNKKTQESQYVLSVMWQGHKHFIIQGAVEGGWKFEGKAFPTIPILLTHQLESKEPVTHRSQAILKTAILREDWELKNDDIKLMKKIGNGNFGDVHVGNYIPKNLEVAVKTCRETLGEDAKKKFLQEGKILMQYDHPNIVRFIGIAAQRQPVMIVMEYVPGGALLSFLRKEGKGQSAQQLTKMCEDTSAGMAYLEEKNCIHRDLAARNCLVGDRNVIKISDFGMSREEEEYTVSDGLKAIPIKWTAPEALHYGKYTSACDVWSYGILMWEIFALGSTPYQGMSNTQAREKLDLGYRMPAPDNTPGLVHKLMMRCWEKEPEDRPKFDEIHRELKRIMKLV